MSLPDTPRLVSDGPVLSSRDQLTVLIVSSVAGFVSTFMSSAVNIALPVIDGEFHVTTVTLGWIPLAYILTCGAGLMPAGQLSDIFGRKRIFLVGMIVFTVFSAAPALAPSADWIIGFRLAQGVGAALLFATTTAMVISAYPPERRGRALGLQISGVYLGLTLGPALGGILIHGVGWRGLFWVMCALGVLNCIATVVLTRGIEWRDAKRPTFDGVGSAIYAVSLSMFLVGLSMLPSVLGVVLLVVGVMGVVVFVWWEQRASNPIMRIDLLRRNRMFAYSNLSSLINYSATFAMTFLVSLYLEYVRGLNSMTAGFVLVAGLFLQAVASPVSGWLVDRVPARLVAAGGMALCVFGLLGLTFVDGSTAYWHLISLLCLLGIGFGLFAPAITHSIMGSVEGRDVSVASATVATMRLAGQNISLGLATLILALVVGQHEIHPADYPNLLTSVRITFAVFTVLCVLGVGASLAGGGLRSQRR
jgi:EmrB/QacA subfamily drug resistance transporter